MDIAQHAKLLYEEVAKCARCGFCLPNCPTYGVRKTEAFSARGRNTIIRAIIEGRLDLTEELAKALFTCLGCGACTKACFPAIRTRDAVVSHRACMAEAQLHPKIFEKLAETVREHHNISGHDNGKRMEWKKYLKGVPAEFFDKGRADIVYFVGCVASFFPMAQQIPADLSAIMLRAGLDFTVLGGEEWCCGFPLREAGMPEKVAELKDHNIEKVRSVGARQVVFSCPSCLSTWAQFYDAEIEVLHASRLIADLIKQAKLELKPLKLTVTYHDPCYLGRHNGGFEEPRDIIKSIPGIQFVELPNNRNMSTCCGGGGNVEMVDPDLSAAVAQRKLEEILATGADTVISSCQQCLKTMATQARRQNINLNVLDLVQLVMNSLAQD